MGKTHKTDYYWQKSVNSVRNYVDGLDWLTSRINQIRLLEIYPINPLKKATRLMAYMEGGVIYYAKFNSYEKAKQFVVQTQFNKSNKEIHAT